MAAISPVQVLVHGGILDRGPVDLNARLALVPRILENTRHVLQVGGGACLLIWIRYERIILHLAMAAGE